MAGSGVPHMVFMDTQDTATDSPFMAKVMMPWDWVVDSAATSHSVSMVSTLHSAASAAMVLAAMALAATASVATALAATALAATALAATPSVDWELVTALASQVSPVAAETRVPWEVLV